MGNIQMHSMDFMSGILNAIADPVFVKDRQHRWLFLNNAFCKFIGHPLENLLGKSDYDFFPAYQADVFWAKDEAVLESGQEDINEEEFTDADGIKHTILTKKTCYTAADGQQILVGVITDITERKRMESALNASEEKHRTVFEYANDGIFLHRIVERDGTAEFILHDLNHKGCELWGHSREDILSGNFDLLAMNNPPYSFEEAKRRNRLAAAGEPQLFDWELKRGNGSKIWGEVNLRRIQIGGEAFLLAVMRDLNERKQMKEALRRNQMNLAEAQRIGQMGSWELDFASGVLTWSDEIYRMFEIDPALFGASYEEFVNAIHPDDRDAVNSAYTESLKNRTSYYIEHRLLFADGRIKHVRECCETQYDEDGEPVRSLGTVQDITARKLMESELRSQAEFQRVLLDAMKDVGIQLMMIEDGRIIYVGNRELARQFGYTDAELDAHPALADIIHPDDREKVVDYYLRRLGGEPVPTSYELGLVTRSGERREFETAVAIVPDSQPVRVITVGKDISERKRMEEQALRREQEFRTLAENSPDIIVRYDRDCRFVYANPAFEKLIGLGLNELHGKMPTQISDLAEAEFFQQRVQEVIETGRADEFEHSLPMHDGNSGWALVSIFPELDAECRIAYVQVLSRDITALKEAEKYLEESRAHLRQLIVHQEEAHEQERKQISWDMHEDLLQVLSAMHTYATMLQANSDGIQEHVAKSLPSLISGLQKSIQMVREMVVSLRPTVLNLGIVAALEWLADEFSQHSGMVCKLRVSEEAVQLDEKSGLVVFRIVQEALAFTLEHRKSARAGVTLECNKSGSLLTIRDKSRRNGIDTSNDNFLSLFGLQERVLAMGGEMVVFSAPDHGLIIEAQIPVQDTNGD